MDVGDWFAATDEVLDELAATGVQSRETLVQWLDRRHLDANEWIEWAEHRTRAIERVVSEGDQAYFAVSPDVAKIRARKHRA